MVEIDGRGFSPEGQERMVSLSFNTLPDGYEFPIRPTYRQATIVENDSAAVDSRYLAADAARWHQHATAVLQVLAAAVKLPPVVQEIVGIDEDRLFFSLAVCISEGAAVAEMSRALAAMEAAEAHR